jgi:hypothetical protein
MDLKYEGERMWTEFIWLQIEGQVAGSCEQGNKRSDPIKGREFIE